MRNVSRVVVPASLRLAAVAAYFVELREFVEEGAVKSLVVPSLLSSKIFMADCAPPVYTHL